MICGIVALNFANQNIAKLFQYGRKALFSEDSSVGEKLIAVDLTPPDGTPVDSTSVDSTPVNRTPAADRTPPRNSTPPRDSTPAIDSTPADDRTPPNNSSRSFESSSRRELSNGGIIEQRSLAAVTPDDGGSGDVLYRADNHVRARIPIKKTSGDGSAAVKTSFTFDMASIGGASNDTGSNDLVGPGYVKQRQYRATNLELHMDSNNVAVAYDDVNMCQYRPNNNDTRDVISPPPPQPQNVLDRPLQVQVSTTGAVDAKFSVWTEFRK